MPCLFYKLHLHLAIYFDNRFFQFDSIYFNLNKTTFKVLKVLSSILTTFVLFFGVKINMPDWKIIFVIFQLQNKLNNSNFILAYIR